MRMLSLEGRDIKRAHCTTFFQPFLSEPELRTVMSTTSEVSTPMLVLGIAQPMTMTQRATITSLATSRDEEGGPNDPNYAVDYGGESDASKDEETPPRALEQCLKLRTITITPSTKASKVLKQSDIMRLVANKDIY
jgi:hypothetical protein